MNPSKCVKCHKIPDDILMLQCAHDLCLPCAAKGFANQSLQPKKNKKRDYICDLCGVSTELDVNSIYELEKMYLQSTTLNDKSNKKQITKQAQSSDKAQKFQKSFSKHDKENGKSITMLLDRTNEKQTRTSLHQSQRQLSKQQSENSFLQGRGQCIDHPEEEVSYYCFDCQTHCICPECIIHGIHKNHEVKTIKKSYPIIKKSLEEQLDLNNQQLSQIENYRNELEKKSVQQQSVQEHYKQQLMNEFQAIHQLLNQKQQELIDKIDNTPSILNQNECYLNKLGEVENKMNAFNENIQDVIYSKDECTLLNYYGSIKNQAMPILPTFPQIRDNQVSNQIFLQMQELKKSISLMDIEDND